MEVDLTKTCRHCHKQFTKLPKTSYKQWSRQFCCSKECGDKSKATPWLRKYDIKKGQRLSPETEFKKGQHAGDKNPKWKGEEAGYFAKHIWANNHFGKPPFCEHCKTTARRMYHWANISGKYLREREDWLRLCVPCHKRFDLDNIKGIIFK